MSRVRNEGLRRKESCFLFCYVPPGIPPLLEAANWFWERGCDFDSFCDFEKLKCIFRSQC